jgi:NO-binding membrane sensor protein with MHYT domain
MGDKAIVNLIMRRIIRRIRLTLFHKSVSSTLTTILGGSGNGLLSIWASHFVTLVDFSGGVKICHQVQKTSVPRRGACQWWLVFATFLVDCNDVDE